MRLLFFGLVISFNSFSQFSKNTIFLNGFGSYSFEKGPNSINVGKNNSENLVVGTSPGYFIINNFVVGGTINWSFVSQLRSYSISANNTFPYTLITNEASSRVWAIGPFTRYYFWRGLYFEANYLFGKSKFNEEVRSLTYISSNNVGSSSYSTNQFGSKSSIWALGAGYSVILNKSRNLGIDLGFYYRNQKQSDITYNGLSVNLALVGFLSLK